jgi:transcriptional regulator with XRE-family HTH domain
MMHHVSQTLKVWSETMAAKPAHPVDVHVGGRVRMRRIEVKMSQQILGGQIGLTFQQVQKYEKGANRIGASRLQEIGRVLEVPASYFYEGAPGGWEGAASSQTSNTLLELLGTREGQSLVANFGRITDVDIRRNFVDQIERVAALVEAAPKPKRSRPSKPPKKK